MWIIIVILLSILLLTSWIGLFLAFKKLQNSVKSYRNIEVSVRDGFKDAIKELEEEKKQEDKLLKSLDRNRQGIGLYSSIEEEKPIKVEGALIPSNLTESEKEILRMFYDQ